jgi:predicted metalloprotease with PDZ domain
MKKLFLVVFATCVAAVSFSQTAQHPIFYLISFPNAAHHEAEIVLTVPQAPSGPLQFRMSRSSAGRYAPAEFGKNISNIKATDVDGNELPLKQIEGDVYGLDTHPETVKISYTLFADWTDGTYADIDESHAHLNMPAVILWTVGQDARAIKLEFNDIDKYGWKVATQLKDEGGNAFSAPNLQYLMDSPVEASNFKKTSWKVTNTDGKVETMNLAAHSDDSQETIDNYGKMVQKIVLEEKAVFGELPAYDLDEYTFLDDVYPGNSGDGMEHRNSTCIVETDKQIAGNESTQISTVAHEFFHCWNVKRIRPKSLEPFNFTHANISSELWFAEGFTEYYGELIPVRAGIHSVDEYTKTIAGLVNEVLNTPAAAKYPQTQMSRYAVFADAGVSVDPVDKNNIFTSYYYYGGATALALDLRLRSEFNLTLDDYMKAVWLAVGKKPKPYTITDLQKILAKLTNPKFADDFFTKYINGIQKNDYTALLAKAGLLLQKANPGKAWAGPIAEGRGRGRTASNGLAIQTSTLMGSPIYKAGLDAGDVILKADGQEINNEKAFNDIVAAKKAGDKIVVDYKNRTGTHQATIILEESPYLQVVTFEKAGKELSKDQQDFRNNWLSSKVK